MKISAQLQKRISACGGSLDALIDVVENTQKHRANGRKLGSETNKLRAEECRSRWRAKAERLKEERPYLALDQLASEIYNWCRQNQIKMHNGKYYALSTIQRDLRAQIDSAPR